MRDIWVQTEPLCVFGNVPEVMSCDIFSPLVRRHRLDKFPILWKPTAAFISSCAMHNAPDREQELYLRQGWSYIGCRANYEKTPPEKDRAPCASATSPQKYATTRAGWVDRAKLLALTCLLSPHLELSED